MNKGFTLAEVLITLGIIGVVAALTAPALVQNAGNAKIGPTLSKVVATLENAHEQILHDEEATDLSKVAGNLNEYMEILSKYINGSSYSTDYFTTTKFSPAFTFYDKSAAYFVVGTAKEFKFSDNISLILAPFSSYTAKGSFKGDCYTMYIDINGPKTAPNSIGKDIFTFRIDKSGQVVPFGSTTYAWLRNDDTRKYTATTNSDYSCNETIVTKGYGCSGSIFENNLKVIYQ